MNKLLLNGQLLREGENTFILYRTQSKEFKLPIEADNDELFKSNKWVSFSGELRTQTYYEGERRRKRTFGHGTLCDAVMADYVNEFQCMGTVVKIFELRTTPLSKRKVIDFTVAVDNNYYNCIAFGEQAENVRHYKREGDEINVLIALFQSREYEKNGKQVAYEVCVRKFV